MKKVLLSIIMMAITSPALAGHNSVQGVIGKDERYQITKDNSRVIHRSIGLLEIRYAKDWYMCSGTVVGPKHVITAAHCLFENGKFPDEVKFYPGIKNSPETTRAPFGVFKAVNVQVFAGYAQTDGEPDYDVGMISVDRQMPVAPLSLAVAPEYSQTDNHTLKVTGYPGDKDYGTMWESQWTYSSTFKASNNSHLLDTMPGMSGSSIRIGSKVVAIHSSGQMNEDGKYVLNHAHFFNAKTLNAVHEWMQEKK
jgi:V8-like Glu-specific endopeptidase